MTTTITVRGLNPQDKRWLQQEARTRGVSMEALVRQFIHERREKSERHATLADAFRRHFGREHGVELPPRARYGYRPVEFARSWYSAGYGSEAVGSGR